MLRKIAAGTSAAVVVAGLAAAPAVAAGLPASAGDGCGDATQTEQNTVERRATQEFVFGPLADVPHLRSAGPSCEIVTPVDSLAYDDGTFSAGLVRAGGVGGCDF